MDIKEIIYTELALSKADLDKVQPIYRKRYIMLTSMIRDLTILGKLIYYVKNNKAQQIPLQDANVMANMFFLITLISKIHEMCKFLHKNNVLCELKNTKLSSDLNKNIDEINKFFGDNPADSRTNTKETKLFHFIRNKFGFHYEDRDKIDPVISEAFDRFGDKEFKMYLTTNDSANDIFSSLNSVILLCIYKKMDQLGFSGNYEEKTEELFSLAAKGAMLFIEFCNLYLAEICKIKWVQLGQVRVEAENVTTTKLPIVSVKI